MQIEDILDKNKTPIFACIGTRESFYDNTSNRIGERLKEHGLNVVLNFDNETMQSKLTELETLLFSVDNPQIIALDLVYSDKYKKTDPYYCYKKGINPGSAFNHKHAPIGDV